MHQNEREAVYHNMIGDLIAVTDPEQFPDLILRASAVLVDCENPVCKSVIPVCRAVTELLKRKDLRWKHKGYGISTCTSCGALHQDEGPQTDQCSPTCPWAKLEALMND